MLKKKSLSVVMSLLLILSTLVVVTPVTELQAIQVPDPLAGFKISDVVIEYNGTELSALTEPITMDATVVLRYTWSIADTDKIAVGDTISVDVPSVLDFDPSGLDIDIIGDLVGMGESFGTYTVDVSEGKLYLELSETSTKLSNVNGTVQFELNFDLVETVVAVPYEMLIPLVGNPDKAYSVSFDVSDNPTVSKSGEINDADASQLDWEVLINTDLQSVASVVVTDTIDSRLIYTDGSMVIRELTVMSDGSTVEGDVFTDYTVSYVDGSKTLEVNFDSAIDGAYQIGYSTGIDPLQIDTSKTLFEYSNDVSFNGSTDQATVEVTGGEIIEKSNSLGLDQKYNTSEIDWSILVNEANYPLNSVSVIDEIPSGIALDVTTLKVYKTDGNGDKLTPALTAGGVDYTLEASDTSSDGSGGFTINLGNIVEDYLIEYTTDVTEEAKNNNETSVDFDNEARLVYGVDGTIKSVTETSTINKGKRIAKSGSASISYNEAKYINWTVDLNTAEIDLGTSLYTDVVVDTAKHTLDLANGIKVYRVDIDETSTSGTQTTTLLTEGTHYDLTSSSTAGFTLDFTDGDATIQKAYQIKYRTQLDKNSSGFVNTGYIGDGSGDVEVSTSLSPSISNGFTKAYKGIDYATNVMTWEIQVRPIKEAVEDLEITDTLYDELMMTSAQYNDIQVLKGSTTPLTKGVDYLISSTETDGKIKGFVINFKDDALGVNHSVNNNTYTISYKTTMDPDVTSDNGDLTYKNDADFTYTGGSSLNKVPNPNLPNYVRKNGYKEGDLNREDKEVEWTIYTNLLSKNMDDLVLVDSFDDHQRLISDSIEITPYVLGSGSDVTIVTTSAALSITSMAALGFVIEENVDLDGFTITYPDFINTPYMVTYTTEFYGISETQYNNSATIGDETYTAAVDHPEGDDFISKEGSLIGQDSIDWEVEVNLSQSTIKNLVITDSLSEGLQLDMDSFGLKDADGDTVDFDSVFEAELRDKEYFSDPDIVDIRAIGTITTTYTITYSTDIFKEDVVNKEVSNNITVEGDEVVSGVRSATETIALAFISGSGTGSGQVGSLRLKKTDTDGNPLVGAEFELYKIYTDDPAKLLGTLTTDSIGEASASRLKYGTYKLVEITAPEGYVIDVESTEFTISNTTEKLVEINNLKKAELGNYVWYDVDRDGVQDASETGVSGVAVELYQDGSLIASTSTDTDGYYTFTGLGEGVYDIKFTLPDGYTVTIKDSTEGTDSSDSDGISDSYFDELATITTDSLAYDDSNMTYDLGIYESFSLGDYTWLDRDADGLQDTDEEGIDGITISLYDGADDTLLATTETVTKDGVKGYYIFDDLPMGQYYIKETSDVAYILTTNDVGGSDSDALDSDVDPTTKVSGIYTFDATTPSDAHHNPTVDIGYYTLASLGNYVWHDEDYDGVQDGDEEGIANVKVTLYDSDGNIVQVDGEDFIVTDSDGKYEFVDLVPGDYSVSFDLPDDWYLTHDNKGDDALDSDATLVSEGGRTAVINGINLESGEEDLTNDVGLFMLASLGDYVWYDTNKNGLQGDVELPVEGVTVTLVDEEGNTQTTVTDEAGYYLFDDLYPGDYYLEFELPSGYVFTTQDSADDLNDDTNDSDVDSVGVTGVYTLSSNEHIPTIDAGIYKKSKKSDDDDEEEVVEETPVVEEEVEETTEEVVEEVTEEEEETQEELFVKETGDTDTEETTDEIVFVASEKVKTVTVKEPPTKGTIEIDEEGTIIYVPGPDFDGTDQVTLIITNDEGEEEEFILDIFDEIPQAGLLPETGGVPTDIWIGFGVLVIATGLVMKRRKKLNE